MTAPKPAPDLARGMRYALDLADKEDERIAKLSDEDFAKEMASLPPPSRVPDFDELLSGVKKKAAERQAPAKVAPLGDRAGRRAPWVAWLVAAAVAAVALTLFVERRELAAWLHPAPPIGPAPDQIKEPTPAEKAEALRVDADKACAGESLGPVRAQARRSCEAQSGRRHDPARRVPARRPRRPRADQQQAQDRREGRPREVGRRPIRPRGRHPGRRDQSPPSPAPPSSSHPAG